MAAVAAGVVLFAEAFGVFMLLMTVGIVVENQSMSLDGLDPAMMSGGALGFGIFSAVFLAGCGLVLLFVGARDRARRASPASCWSSSPSSTASWAPLRSAWSAGKPSPY
ncbi:hypothetical protein ACFQVA_13780 [Actinomadura keratinilytica]